MTTEKAFDYKNKDINSYIIIITVIGKKMQLHVNKTGLPVPVTAIL